MARYSSFGLTDAGDLDPDNLWVSGAEAIKSTAIARLLTAKGTYFADLGTGLETALVFGSLSYLGQALAEIQSVLAGVPGVRAVEVTQDAYDAATRTATLTALLQTDQGEIDLDLSEILVGSPA